jgi:citrate lyase beta subunit
MRSLKFGATMYMPSIRSDLAEVGNGLKYSNLRTVVFCLEDSISQADLTLAFDNVKKLLPRLQPSPVHRLLRPRNPAVLAALLETPFIGRIDGFVLPKADRLSIPGYLSLLEPYEDFVVMPTLETRDVFDLTEMYRLRDYLATSPLKPRIPVLRVGSMDLLGILSLRRDIDRVIYDTPVGHAIDQLITVFRPVDLALSGTSFEGLDRPDVLVDELSLDVDRGLFAKTCVHPSQIDIIHAAYKVRPEELEMAEAIVDPTRPAVFRMGGRMCEKAVHSSWAAIVLERAAIFGAYPKTPFFQPDQDTFLKSRV